MNSLHTACQRLAEDRLKCLTLLPSGHAFAVHRWGTLRFESLEDLAAWIESGIVPRRAYQKFRPEQAAEASGPAQTSVKS